MRAHDAGLKKALRIVPGKNLGFARIKYWMRVACKRTIITDEKDVVGGEGFSLATGNLVVQALPSPPGIIV